MKNKKISILGLGKSGIAAANLAVSLGAKVFISDSAAKRKIKGLNKKVAIEFGGHSDAVLNAELIIKSPGIHSDIPIISTATRKKIKVISEMQFALSHLKHKKIIAITGTNGKTTTTDLLSKIIATTVKDSFACGNIGFPLSGIAPKTTKKSFLIIEASSYQLEDSSDFKPDISILLNIAKDHIDHHKTMAAYIKAKGIIFTNQTSKDFAVLNFDDKVIKKISAKTKAKKVFFSTNPVTAEQIKKSKAKNFVFYDKGQIIFNFAGKIKSINPKIKIVGMHNVQNILAASAGAFCAGIKISDIEKVISKYKGVAHRIEFVRSLNGIDFYNDSKATNIDSTKVALESFDKNIWLIMGGQDKKFPYTCLSDLVKQKVKGILLVGEAAPLIKKDLSRSCTFYDCQTIENAVKKSQKLAKSGDIVLLSPACASWDQFPNFEVRGDVFKEAVKKL